MNALLTALLLGGFRFTTPEGWTDGCAAPREALPEEVRADAERLCASRDGGTLFAVDLRHVDENAVATFNGVVLNGAPALEDGGVQRIADGFVALAARKGEKLELVEAAPHPPGAKLRFLRSYRSDRMDVFVIPHEGETAMLTFIAPIGRYEEYAPVFAATASNVIAPPEEQFTPALKVIAFVSVLFGAGLGFLLMRRRRRKA